MKILVTGGAGFIGSHVCDLLIGNGHTVSVIDNLSTGKKENLPADTSLYETSIADNDLISVLQEVRPDAVVHHAAQISVGASVKDPFYDMDINIRGTLNLLQACVSCSVKKFVFASTGGAIYGEHDYFPADELHPLRPLSPYGISKLAGEKYVYFYHKTYGIDYTVLRYSNVYGPRQDPFGEAGVVAIFSQKMLAGEQPVINGTGEQTRDFVFVKDVARANICAVEQNKPGEFNISTGTETTVNRLFAVIKNITGSKADEVHGSAVPAEQLRSVLSWDKAHAELGWEPAYRLESGLAETLDYFRKK